MSSKIILSPLLALLAVSPCLQAVVINDVDWSNAYQPNKIDNDRYPNDASGVTGGVWTLGTSTGTASIIDEHLSIETSSAIGNYFYSNNSNWSGSTGMTVEARLRVSNPVSANGIAGQLRIGGTSSLSDNKYIYLNFTATQISYGGLGVFTPVVTGLNLSEFTTVRFVLSSDLSDGNADALKIYVDDEYAASVSGAVFNVAAGTNNIIFGDVISQIGGTSDWNYIAYKQGQWAPIPEPQSLTLLGLAGVAGILLRRKKGV